MAKSSVNCTSGIEDMTRPPASSASYVRATVAADWSLVALGTGHRTASGAGGTSSRETSDRTKGMSERIGLFLFTLRSIL